MRDRERMTGRKSNCARVFFFAQDTMQLEKKKEKTRKENIFFVS